MMGRIDMMSLMDSTGLPTSLLRAPLLGEASASQTLGMILWIGLAILTVALLVLMRTRWGQAQPLSKCVVLSVFAHVLFIAYAYGTRLIFDAPAPPEDQAFRLAFIARDNSSVDMPRKKQAWDAFPAEFAITPDIASPSQQDVLTTADAPPVVTERPAFAIAMRDAPVSNPGIETPRPTPPTHFEEVLAPAEPIEIEVARSERPTEPQPIPELPNPPPLERLASEQLSRPASAAAAATDSPNSLPDSSTLQRLTDVDFSRDIAEARPSSIDMTAAADNRDLGTRQDGHDDSLDPGTLGSNSQTSSPGIVAGTGGASAARRLGDGQPLPEVFQLRMARNQMALIEQQGGNERTEQAVEAALKWLAAHQSPDGRWDVDKFEGGRETKVLGHDRKGAGMEADTGITGLALLTFLSAGHTHFEGEYRRTVQHGLEFVLGQQAPDGNLAGSARLFARMYCHGMATLAISEAYAMTGDHRMRGYVERAVQYTVDSQDRTTGGWRYQPADQGDMSQLGWQVMALKSAELAGITVPGETRAGMIRFLRSVSKGEHRGLASYRPSERASETMTAEALACRYFLNIQQDERAIREATNYLSGQLPSGGQANLYYWYYATIGLFQSRAMPTSPSIEINQDVWPQWNEALQQQLLARQQRHGDDAGSFSPDTVWGSYGGRVYATAMATLCLEVYYRYLPVYERGSVVEAAARNNPQYRVL
ncbi:MAG: prenyltransferase/squalene oxidase repeat-containing protein, partial [Pirellulaceae bacterium]